MLFQRAVARCEGSEPDVESEPGVSVEARWKQQPDLGETAQGEGGQQDGRGWRTGCSSLGP